MPEENIMRIDLEGKEIILIGTAHVSRKSAEQVKEIIHTERPDSVCIELDEQRYQSIMDRDRWKNMDIFKVIKEKKAVLLLMNLFISSFQKRMANQFGIKPGEEMIRGIEASKEIGASLVLADRNIQTTFSRIWQGIGFWGKLKLLFIIFYSIFSNETISEEELEKMKEQDILNAMLLDFTESFPTLKVPLVDERDQYLAQKIKDAPGKKVVAVLGAAHLPGIKKEINKKHDLEALSRVPAGSGVWKTLAWLIPLLIIGIVAYTFYTNPSAGVQQAKYWILWNGLFASLGAAIAFGHPLTILTAFVAAPITSLNPLLAAGWFAGLVQAYIRRPSVGDFESLSMDVYSVKGFWNNKVTRILLIVALTNLGSTLGTVIAGADIVRLFLESL